MIPDFKGIISWRTPSPVTHHRPIICERCGMEAIFFNVGRRGKFLKADCIPLNALPVPACNLIRPRPASSRWSAIPLHRAN